MKYLSIKEQLRLERRNNEAQNAATVKTKADLDYMAMMTGVELETEATEVKNDDEV